MEFWSQLSLEHPGRLAVLVLVPVLVVLYVWASRQRKRRGVRYTNTSMLGVVIPRQSQWRRHLAVAFTLLSLFAVAIAWAKPMTLTDVPRERATIVVVMDVSLSMQATDVKPNRLAAATEAAGGFVDGIPDRFNVALVTLSGSPAIVVPPTQDHGAVTRAIQTLTPQESTALGDAIATGLRALEQAPRDPNNPQQVAPGAMVLLSDGENTSGQAPAQAAREAAEMNVAVHTIAYGTENGYVDVDGSREPVPPDTETLAEVSEVTEGQAYTADNARQLRNVYEEIGSSVGVEKQSTDVTSTFAGYAIIFALLAAVSAVSLAVRP